MAGKPLIAALETEPDVRVRLHDALSGRFGDRFQVVACAGAPALAELTAAGTSEPVALLLVAHAPGLSCDDIYRAAGPLAPYAKRVLMVGVAETDAATRALAAHHIDAYVIKPMVPYARLLFPVLDEALDDWWATQRPVPDLVQVYGYRWCPRTFAIKDFLSRQEIPYRWQDLRPPLPLDVEGHADRSRCAPVVRLPGGETLAAPEISVLAARLGLPTQAKRDFYDVVILGAGPAGLAAAVYGASEGLRTLVLDEQDPGGQAGTSSLIENYLGFPAGLTGADLARRAVAQAKKFGAELLDQQRPKQMSFGTSFHRVRLRDDREVGCHALVLATGVQYRRLEVPGSDRFNGAGVYYGSVVSEAPTCRDEPVLVVGGGNSAGQAALHLSKYAASVEILVRSGGLELSMSKYLCDEIAANPRVRVTPYVVVSGLAGEGHLEEVTLTDVRTHATSTRRVQSLFVFIGAAPQTGCLEDRVLRDEQGYVLTGPWLPQLTRLRLETSVPGLFAIGDVRHASVKRVAGAVGDGAAVVELIHQYLTTR